MAGVAYVNGRYQPINAPAIWPEDRGYQFADGVYEVIGVTAGRRVDGDAHFDRLERSLGAIRLPMPMTRAALNVVLDQVALRNRVRDGIVYLQVTRGPAPRNAPFPLIARPVLTATARSTAGPGADLRRDGVAVITTPDLRGRRNDIKSVGLLANVLAKQKAVEAGAYEAWLVDGEGFVTEGGSTNAWIVTPEGAVRTHPTGTAILGGITRARIAKIARGMGVRVEERPFTVPEALSAAEAFLTSTAAGALAISRIDGRTVGAGGAGALTSRLAEAYRRFAVEGEDA